MTNQLPIHKAIIINNIIGDALDKLKDFYKPDSIRGRGLVKNILGYEPTSEESIITIKIDGKYFPKVLLGNKRTEKTIVKDLKDFRPQYDEPAAYVAMKMLSCAVIDNKVQLEEKWQPMLNEVKERLFDSNITREEFWSVLEAHAKNNFKKFSDAVALSKK